MSILEISGGSEVKIVVVQEQGIPGSPGAAFAGSVSLTSSVSLTNDVVGVLPTKNGGTNSSASLNNNRIMVSTGGQIRESSALLDGQILIGSTGSAPIPATLTAGSNITITNGSNSITIASSGGGGSSGSTSLINQVSGVLPVGNGGTNSSTTLNNNRNIISSGGQIVESAAINAGVVLVSNASGIPTHSTVSSLTLSFLDATSSIQTQINTKRTLASISLTTDVINSLPLSQTSGSISLLNQVRDNLPLSQTSGSISLSDKVSGVLIAGQGGTNSSANIINNRIVYTTNNQFREFPALTDGQVIIGVTGSTPVGATLTAGSNVTITNGSGTITISATGGGSSGSISLINQVSGVLPISNGGTNASTSLNNNRMMVSTAGQIREGSALGDGQIFIGSNGAAPQPANITAGSNITIANGSNSITISATGGGVAGSISLLGQVSGVLPISSGGTNSSTTLNNNRVVVSSGGQILETAAITAGRVLVSNALGIPTHSTVSSLTLSFLDATSSIQTQLDSKRTLASISLTTDVINNLPLSQTSGSISLLNQVRDNLPLSQTTGSIDLALRASGVLPLSQTSGSISLLNRVSDNLPISQTSGSVSLSNKVSGLLATTFGGTNSSAALNNNRIIYSTGGAIREFPALTDGQVIIGVTNSTPVGATLTAGSNVTITNGSGTITIAASGGGASADVKKKGFGITIDGGGAAITAGIKGYVTVPYGGTITQWTLLADQTGSIVIDVAKDTYANFPPTFPADIITDANKPTLSSQSKNQATASASWTTLVAAGDTFAFICGTITAVQRVHLLVEMDVN